VSGSIRFLTCKHVNQWDGIEQGTLFYYATNQPHWISSKILVSDGEVVMLKLSSQLYTTMQFSIISSNWTVGQLIPTPCLRSPCFENRSAYIFSPIHYKWYFRVFAKIYNVQLWHVHCFMSCYPLLYPVMLCYVSLHHVIRKRKLFLRFMKHL